MIKRIFQALLAGLASYVGRLGLFAEGGDFLAVPGFKTNSDYSVLASPNNYIIVAATAAGQANQATDAGSSTILGVMQNNPKVGEAMTIACAGRSKVVAGGAITANAIITTNASGRATTVGSAQVAIGRALEAADADGDVITAMLFHPVRWTGAA